MEGSAVANFQSMQENFDQVVPGAAGKSDAFLGEVMKRTNAAGLGLTLAAVQPKRKDPRVVLRGQITFGNAWKGKRPYTLEVYADDLGVMLQTGWQLTTEELGGLMGATSVGDRVRYQQSKIDGDPNTIRQLNGVLQAFHQAVFLPTLNLLVQATGGAPQGSGFLGA